MDRRRLLMLQQIRRLFVVWIDPTKLNILILMRGI